jgi:ribonucleotide reductase alpha subunit
VITQEQIEEWTENPVTLELKALAIGMLDETVDATKTAYSPGNPQKTQETLAIIAGAQGVWDTLIEALEGDWSYINEEEDE